jgi:hypothetical protein
VATGAIRVRGLRELQRDFKKISKQLSQEVKDSLVEAADPVKQSAQELALGEIRNMPESPRWAEMRIGVTARSVYMVPQARRRGGHGGRPNLANLLLERAMDPALERRADDVVRGVDAALGHLFDRNGF